MYLVSSDNKNYLRVFDREIANRLAENIGGSILTTIKPIQITHSKIDRTKHVATFKYHDGIQYANMNKLEHTVNYSEMLKGAHYCIVCGDVLLVVDKDDYPEIERKQSW